MKNILKISLLSFCICMYLPVSGKEYRLQSPNGNLSLSVNTKDQITWSVFLDGKEVMENCPVSLTLTSGRILGQNPKVTKLSIHKIDQSIRPEVPRKQVIVKDQCNELTIFMKDNYSITFRAYNYGMAYRFETTYKDVQKIKNEQLNMNFSQDVTSYFPEEESFISHNERHYVKEKAKDISSSHFCSLPVLFQDPTGVNILFTEADLYDYPCMFLFGSGQNTLKAGFPKQVLDITVPEGADRSEIISKEADYIATVAGTRNFPWRLFYITKNLGDIIENDLVYQLSRPVALKDTKWIKPGKVSWDWWNANNIYGVDFKSGINTDTYKYYIDFASKFGLQYIILDEGWSKTTTNVLESNSDINVEELVRYGKEKGVGVILWTLWKPLDKDMSNILDQFSKWGVKGIKVDFMQRSDQFMVNYYERVAKEAAKRHLLVDFHGAFKPSGLHRAYPNVLSYEGVKGMENDKWSKEVTPEHDVTLPFTRMAAGPMDFTPGAMLNAQPKDFYACFDRPMSMGTRCHQIAMYMVYESPLQMMADSPSNYYKESECAGFISRIPTTWDETKVLDAKVGEYIVIARKNGNKWYIGAMTNETEREFQIDLSFLSKGEHQAEIMQDGVNAYKNAIDYKKVKTTFNSKDKVKISLAPGGGWAAIVSE